MDRTRTYDVMCKHLAEHFFRNHPLGTDENVDALALHIQDAIEEKIADIEAEADQ